MLMYVWTPKSSTCKMTKCQCRSKGVWWHILYVFSILREEAPRPFFSTVQSKLFTRSVSDHFKIWSSQSLSVHAVKSEDCCLNLVDYNTHKTDLYKASSSESSSTPVFYYLSMITVRTTRQSLSKFVRQHRECKRRNVVNIKEMKHLKMKEAHP